MRKQTVHYVKLAGDLYLRQAEEVRETLRSALETNQTVHVHTTAITELDLSIVQLLIAAFRSAGAAGKSFSVSIATGSVFENVLLRGGFIRNDGTSLTPDADLWAHCDAAS